MIRKILPFVGAAIAAIALIAVGTGTFGGLRLQVPSGTNIAASPAAHGHEEPSRAPYVPLSLVPPADGSRVAVTTAAAAKPEQGYLLSVRVTSPAGKPVGEATIRFYDVVELFGQREELIGATTTDGQGQASLAYLPATKGAHKIVARFVGQGALGPSLGVADFDAAVSAPPYRVDQPGLANFSRYVPYAAGVVVLGVWALIAFSLLGTVRGVTARSKHTTQ